MTKQQVLRGLRSKKAKRKNAAVLKVGPRQLPAPMRAGIVEKIKTVTPKKPNSAQRKVAVVRLKYGKKCTAYIPDQSHKIQSHAKVMIIGGKCQDTPGTRCTIQRGVADAAAWLDRKNKRSKYGVKKPKAKTN